MPAEVVIDFIGKDSFSNVLGNFGSIITGIESAVNLVSGAFEAASDAIQPFIDSAAEAEVSATALQTVWSSLGGAFGISTDELQKMATEMQNLTGYSDEAEQAAEAMLLRFENLSSDIFPDALALTNDLARSLGIDLTAAARAIGMALDDPEQGIGRLNTQFRLFNDTEMETIKNMAANGDVAGAQAIIMDRLREKVGGAAEAYGNTFAGSLDIANEKLDNMREIIGGPIIEILGRLLDQVVEFAETNPVIQEVLSFFTRFNEVLTMEGDYPILTALAAAFADLGDISPVFRDIAFALVDMQNAIKQGEDPFSVLAAGLDSLGESWAGSPLGDIIARIQEFIDTGKTEGWGQAISDLWDDIIAGLNLNEKIQGMLDALTNQIIIWTNSGGAESLSAALGGFLQTVVVNALNGLDETIGQVDFAPIVQAIVDGLWSGIKVYGSGVGDAFWEWFATEVFNDESVDTFWASINIKGGGFDTLVAILFPATSFLTLTDKFRELGGNIIDGLWSGWNSALNAIGLGDMAKWWEDHIVNPIKDFLGIHSASTLFMGIGINIIEGLLGGLDATWKSVTAWFTTKFTNLLNNLTWENILKVITGDMSISDLFASSGGGTVGGGSTSGGGVIGGGPIGGTTGSGTGTGTVLNFYGPVYVGSMSELNYDCDSVSPLLQSSITLNSNPIG